MRNITQKEYDQIISFKDSGVSIGKLANVLGRSKSTVKRIWQSDSLENYRENIRKERMRYVTNSLNIVDAPLIPAEYEFIRITSISVYKNNVFGLGQDGNVYIWDYDLGEFRPHKA